MCDARGTICNECPFSKKSLPGWLASYTIKDIENYVNGEALFPCHRMMPEVDEMTQEQIQENIKSGKLKLCRGYVECIIKSCKLPRYNAILKEARAKVKEEGLSEDSMSLYEFREHHTLSKTKS